MPIRYIAGFISAFYNPLQVPNAPTIGTASPVSATSLSVTFTAPSNVGGGAITGYIATARRTSDGVTISATGSSSPITITGLTAVPLTVTVAAVNSFGPSASSAASNSDTPALLIGAAYEGGFYAGQISTAGTGVADFNLVVAPRASGQSSRQWKTNNSFTSGATSYINGPANSAVMNNATHPAAQFCEGLSIGGYSDWYMPAFDELEVCYYNLKPTTNSNTTAGWTNAYSVPTRSSNYTSGTPAQTSAANFQYGPGSEAFIPAVYWTSTNTSGSGYYGSWKEFSSGNANFNYYKTQTRYVRAIRRVAV